MHNYVVIHELNYSNNNCDETDQIYMKGNIIPLITC
jgi:hypothetical protein